MIVVVIAFVCFLVLVGIGILVSYGDGIRGRRNSPDAAAHHPRRHAP